MKPAIEIQDIFARYGRSYRNVYSKSMPQRHHRAMHAIEICRTGVMGGHVEKCNSCGRIKISYNSCRNRHCPKCQFLKREKWLEYRLNDFLPIPYFHVVFTIPSILNPLVLRNQRVLYDILFDSASETLKELSEDKKYFGAQIGIIAVLHTWGQNLMDHPHLHCIVTGGGLSKNGLKWVSSRDNFFLPVKVISRLFRGKFLAFLNEEYQTGQIQFPGSISYLKPQKMFSALISDLYRKEWNVFSKAPFNNPESVFQYLSRYTHRVAISNQRIVKIENDKVYFKWRDYSNENKTKIMSLNVNEFIRRFLLHVLPDRFVKIRHYGIFSNRNRRKKIQQCQKIFKINSTSKDNSEETWQEKLLRLTGLDVCICPFCKAGKLIPVESLMPLYCNSP